MRRSLASLSLAFLIVVPLVGTAAAAEPSQSAEATASITPSPEPAPTTSESTPTLPSAAPATDEPAGASPTVDPSTGPTASPTESTEPTDPATPTATTTDPSAAPTVDPDPSATESPASTVSDDQHGRPDTAGRFIVVLRDGTDATAVAERHARREGAQVLRTFGRAVRGFTAKLDRAQRQALQADPNVVAVVPDEVIELTSQTTPNGVTRVGTKRSATALIDNIDQRVDADVAIVDTGVAKHPDLNVVGGYNCAGTDRTAWRDGNGHGTHVAGTVAAIDNDQGVVGVAPGARIWAVRILNDDGYGLLSWYICGLDWIAAQNDPVDPSRPRIESVNMSVAKSGSDDANCGKTNDDVLHAAICRVVSRGITVVAAAANDSASASRRVPAAYNEVITVSALADSDGKAGGLGGNRCWSWGTYDVDDTFADFSNYGHDVDIMASGKCIWSTLPGSSYGYSSGTSMAAPAVAGAVALYKSTRPYATPYEVKEALQYLGNLGWSTSTDPDATHEKLLDVGRIGNWGSFSFAATAPNPPIGEDGGTVTLPLSINRSATHFERIRLSVVSAPEGWAATVAPAGLLGWDAKQGQVTITIPAGVKQGTYQVRVRGVAIGKAVETDVQITIDNDAPTARAGVIYPTLSASVALTNAVPSSTTLSFRWFPATDPSSSIAGYQVERRVGTGPWTGTTSFGPSVLKVDVPGLRIGSTHTFRVRARDVVGNWSEWAESAPYKATPISDRSSRVTRIGTWTRAEISGATNDVRSSSTQRSATASLSFTGTSVSVVMPRSATRGKVSIWLDGVKVKTVDTRSSISQARRIVYTKAWLTPGTHKIVVRVEGTAGRPLVSLDGFLLGS